jgi:hypothetical protein
MKKKEQIQCIVYLKIFIYKKNIFRSNKLSLVYFSQIFFVNFDDDDNVEQGDDKRVIIVGGDDNTCV